MQLAIKIFGMIIVLLSSASVGFIMARELKAHSAYLKEIQQAAIYIKSDIEYRMPTFEECFRRRGQLFSRAAKYISDTSPVEALSKAIEEDRELKDDEKAVLMSYAKNLNAEDVGGQMANISLLISRLDELIREYEREVSTKGRLYRSGGVLGGAALVIILF